MKLLLDTAVLIWISDDVTKLSPAADRAYRDLGNELCISVASIWEIFVKHRRGKLPLRGTVGEILAPLGARVDVTILSLNESAVMRLPTLPDVHRDPFDRMLVCQALDEGLTIVTPDRAIASYPVDVLW